MFSEGKAEPSASTSSAAPILPSSTELFHFYRETLEHCASLSTKQPFLDLCAVFKKWLKVYAEEVLGGMLSRPSSASTERRSHDGRFGMKEVVQACKVLNTADYCKETTTQVCA